MGALKKSISLPDYMLKAALDRQKAFGYTTFSDYMQALVKADIQSRPDAHVRVTTSPKKPRKK
jgi:hypothetical protein